MKEKEDSPQEVYVCKHQTEMFQIENNLVLKITQKITNKQTKIC